MRSRILALVLTVLTGCAPLSQESLDARFGPAESTRFDEVPLAGAGVSYRREVKTILDHRCVVCHGCYDAPCQLKLGSWDGIVRGTSKDRIYASLRLLEAPTTRLGVDAQRPSEWRQKEFTPVLNERTPLPEHQLAGSVLYRALALKQEHPLPQIAVLPDSFDFALNRDQTCPNLGEYDKYERDHPLAGMPYGLPGLAPRDLDTIKRWLVAGAPDDPPVPLPSAVASQVADWEIFLNGDSRKEQLMSRYLYEHLFLGHLVFEGDAQRTVFRLVRSATAPGEPVKLIATRRPHDDPGVPRVYYRLQRDDETLLAKTHMPFALSPDRMVRWRGWFLAPNYVVDALPSYDIELASNPFITFAAIPLDSRYRFMLDDAGYFVMNFIKGPVCRGQTALDVINDRFWVFFVDPDLGSDEDTDALVAREAHLLRMPAAEGSNAGLLSWLAMAESEDKLLAVKSEALNRRFGEDRPVDLTYIWRGEGRNPNAALTVFRHFDSASVVQGLVGDSPKTAWVMGYPLLERIYYLLVAGYDVYGNTAHQLQTRLYMDFLRMEGEANFLIMLPKSERDELRDHWYRGAGNAVKDRVIGRKFAFQGETGIAFHSDNAQEQLYQLLRERLAPVLSDRFDLASEPDAELRQGLRQLATTKGAALSFWPEAVVLRVDDPAQPARYFSVLRNTGHVNVASLLREESNLAPDENTLSIVRGFVGAYPNALMHATVAELPTLARDVASLASESDYRALADRHAIRRTNPGFWEASDAMHAAFQHWAPDEAGLFDFGRLENR